MNYAFNGIDKKVLLMLSVIVVTIVLAMSLSSGITGGFLRGESSVMESINVDQTPRVNVTPAEPNCTFVKEEYTEMEPYTEEQCVNVPVVNTTCNTTPLVYSLTKECYWSNELKTLNSKCTVKNIDSDEGTFTVEVGVITTAGKIGEKKTIDLDPLTTGDVTYSYDADIGNCYCTEITIPTKEVCYDKIATEQQCFDVTKYRPRILTREVKKCS